MKNKNILFINGFFNYGGSALACYEAAKNLPKEYNMTFVGHYDGSMRKKFEELGRVFIPKHQHQYDFNYDVGQISELISNIKPDIIHVFLPGSQNPPYFKILPDDCLKICTILCEQEIGFNVDIFDKILFLSAYAKNYQKKQCKNFQVIRAGLTLQEPQYKAQHIGHYTIFGRISAFCPSKKIFDTVRCAERCPKNLFIIAGEVQDYEYYNSIQDYIRHNNIHNIDLRINIGDTDKCKILNFIDVLHYPTTSETFCYGILEGMAHGLPIITYDNGANSEFNHKNNLDLCENFSQILSKTEEYSVANRDFIETKGSINRAIYEEIYTGRRYGMDLHSTYQARKAQN